MNITYHWEGDYLIPDLVVGEQVKHLGGHLGRMRRRFLQEHRLIQFSIMVLNGTLCDYLLETENAARLRLETIIPELTKQAGVTEQIKAANPMDWVQRMNVCKAQAEEIVFQEIIYA